MANGNIPKSDILFFDVGHYNVTSELKSFITYLKVEKAPVPLTFSHIEVSGELIKDLTIKENILLNIKSFCDDENKDLKVLIEQTDNQHLLCLLNQIGDLDRLPSEVSSNKIKLAQIVKGLLKESKYIFIDMPEHNLMDFQLKSLAGAINFNRKMNNQTIFLRTGAKQYFGEATKTITRKKDGHFELSIHTTSKNKLDHLTKKEINSEGYFKFLKYQESKNEAA